MVGQIKSLEKILWIFNLEACSASACKLHVGVSTLNSDKTIQLKISRVDVITQKQCKESV